MTTQEQLKERADERWEYAREDAYRALEEDDEPTNQERYGEL